MVDWNAGRNMQTRMAMPVNKTHRHNRLTGKYLKHGTNVAHLVIFPTRLVLVRDTAHTVAQDAL